MKTLKSFIAIVAILLTGLTSSAQTADEIINIYLEKIGGKEKLSKVNSLKKKMIVNSYGIEIPMEIYNSTSGKVYVKINIYGNEITESAFDGKKGWRTDLSSMKVEKLDNETINNLLSQANDFPDPFYNYIKKGYKAEFLGKEFKEGIEYFKIKLTKTPIFVTGKKEENICYYYFDTKTHLPMIIETEIKEGPSKGVTTHTFIRNYQKIDGLLFPFEMEDFQNVITINSIEINPIIDFKEFEMKTE